MKKRTDKDALLSACLEALSEVVGARFERAAEIEGIDPSLPMSEDDAQRWVDRVNKLPQCSREVMQETVRRALKRQ